MKTSMMGLQLYSVRDDMKRNPSETLKKLSEIGYQNIEHAGYSDRKFYGYSPKEFKDLLNSFGLKMPSSHSPLKPEHWNSNIKDFTDDWKTTLEDAAFMGQQFVINPSLLPEQRNSYDEICRQMDIFNLCGELCKTYEMKFGYHNHDFEFTETIGNQTVFEIMLQKTDPSLVMFQLDTGNCLTGGFHATDLMNKYPKRFGSIHLKDIIPADSGSSEKYESTILTEGIIDLKEIIETARKNNPSVHFIIEQEHYRNKTPIDCMKENFREFNLLNS